MSLREHAMPNPVPAARRRHPLAPLTEPELAKARAVVAASGLVSEGARYVWCTLVEPDKDAVWAWTGEELPRELMLATYERDGRRTSLITVCLDQERVVGLERLSGVQPQILNEEWTAGTEKVKADPRFRAALARRGVTDPALVQVEPWPAGNFGSDLDRSGRRLGRAVAYRIDGPGDNPYAHPIENLVAVLDRDTGEILEIQDGEPLPVPSGSGRYDAASVGASRQLAELHITQPHGPGFSVDDGEVHWGPWSLRVSVHPVEGLVLHQIAYTDGERTRPLIHRASLSEMVVPYGSTGLNHWWKNAFDAGESGLGKLACSLEYGCDCLGEIVYLDAAMIDDDGRPFTIEHAVCLHEEDAGMLWRHHDVGTGRTEVRRSRRFVVSSFATVGNYDYGFFWYFYLDGTIECRVKMTGMILTQAVVANAPPRYANPVTPELAGPHHQHLFSFRLDMCLDGPANRVYEVDAARIQRGRDNPHGNAFEQSVTLLERESDAARLAAPELYRYWQIVNTSSRNACGKPVAYRLVPTHAARLLADESASVSARATFATRHLWVTAFDPEQRRAAGDFPNQHPGGTGLPAFVLADRPLVDTDIVLWHTIGSTHFCRPEDFPVMPCDTVGFMLKPDGFFDRNPALDLAPPYNQLVDDPKSCTCRESHSRSSQPHSESSRRGEGQRTAKRPDH